jgi:hypothetical protein
MIGSMIRMAAYARAPKATFTIFHPAKALRLKKLQWQFRHTEAPRWAATAGVVGAAAVLLPLGLVLGRRAAEQQPFF